MGINFPNAPTTNQLYPQPPVAGLPVYRWDGTKWTTQGAPGSGGGSSVYVSDTPPTGVADDSLWWESDTGALYVRYNDGDSTQWVTAAPVPDVSAYLTSTSQSLSATQQTQSRANIYAAPFDALSYNGMQVNGGMEVSQANGASAVLVSGAAPYVVDGWQAASWGTGAVSAQQVTDAPAGYKNSLSITVTTADPTPGPSDAIAFQLLIEGNRISRCAFGTAAASPISIGFWVKANRPGSYSGALRNGSSPYRSYPFSFSINASATWEYKTVTIPGDTIGTWSSDNTLGLFLYITMLGGTSTQAPAGAWVAGNFAAATGTINGAAATTDYIRVTGVVILPGIELPSAARAPFIMRPYGQELETCRRYFQVMGSCEGTWYAVTQFQASLAFHPEMRTTPTAIIFNGTNGVSLPGTANYNITAVAVYNQNTRGMNLVCTTGTIASAPAGGSLLSGAIAMDARL